MITKTKTEPHIHNKFIYSMFEIVLLQDLLSQSDASSCYGSCINDTLSFLNIILCQIFILSIRHNFMF